MSFRGMMLKAGIDTDGVNVSFRNGLGLNVHDVQILKARLATGTIHGAYLDIDATNFWWEEGMELKYNVTDWVDATVSGYDGTTNGNGYLGAFTGFKIHTQTSEDGATKTLQGIDSDCRVNDVDASVVSSIKAHTYIKGSTAKEVGIVFGGESEVEVANGSGTLTVGTKMIAHEFRIRTSTAVAGGNLLKCHGVVIKAGDTDGQTVTVGTGLLIENYATGGGTVTWTKGLEITDSVTCISLGAFTTAGIDVTDITGMQGDAEAGVKVGSWGTPLSAVAAMTDNIRVFQGSVEVSDGPASGYKEVSIFSGEIQTDGAHDLTYVDFSPIHVKSTVDRVIGWHYGVQCDVFKTGAHNCGDFHAITAYVNIEDAKDFSVTGRFAPICAVASSSGGGAVSVITGDCAVAWLGARGHISIDAILWLHCQASAVATSAIYVEQNAKITNLFKFDAADGCLSAVTETPAVNTSHAITIDINGTPHYIAVWSDKTWGS